jgi:hypothetical protein
MPPGPVHGLSAIFWAGGFLAWASVSWPAFSRAGQDDEAAAPGVGTQGTTLPAAAE